MKVNKKMNIEIPRTFSSFVQSYNNDNFSLNFSNLSFGSGLVNMSAYCSSVKMYCSRNKFSSNFSLMKWYLISMCLVLLWNSGFFTSRIALWLSTYKVGCSLVALMQISLSSLLIQTKPLTASLAEIYSASVDDNDT